MTCRPCPRPATLPDPEQKKTPGRRSPGRKGIVPMSDSTTRAHDLETLRPMTAQEVADLTGWPRGQVYDLGRQGALPVIRLGRRVFFPRPAVLLLLAAGNGREGAASA